MSVVSALISVAISLAVFVFFATIVEVMRRRGWDPVFALANVFSPLPASEAETLI